MAFESSVGDRVSMCVRSHLSLDLLGLVREEDGRIGVRRGHLRDRPLQSGEERGEHEGGFGQPLRRLCK